MTPERIKVCLESATFWAEELPRYADRQQRAANFWSISAGIVAAGTSLAIWPVLSDSSTDFEKLAISIGAFVAAICALVPRVYNFAENAGQARELSSRYGRVMGDLKDLAVLTPIEQERARAAVSEFQAAKERKDTLPSLPDKATVMTQTAKRQRALADAQASAEIARRNLGQVRHL